MRIKLKKYKTNEAIIEDPKTEQPLKPAIKLIKYKTNEIAVDYKIDSLPVEVPVDSDN